MRKTILYFCMIMILLGFVNVVINDNYSTLYVVYSGIIVFFLGILQVCKNIFKTNYYFMSIIQFVISVIALFLGYSITIFLIPIFIFEICGDKVDLLISIIINSIIILNFNIDNIVQIFIYVVTVNMYFYQCKRQDSILNEIKTINKHSREKLFKNDEELRNVSKLIKQNEINTSLRERSYMSQKLHDHLGHRITSSIMQLEVTKEMIGRDEDLSKKYLESAMDNLRKGMDEIRVFLRNSKPKGKVMGIEEIKEDILEFQYRARIKVNFNIQGDIQKINANQLEVLKENINESLTNIGKYSRANVVNISFFIYNKFARIEIEDDGVGTDKIVKGLGLMGIEERLNKINGRVEFSSNNGFKTTMLIYF